MSAFLWVEDFNKTTDSVKTTIEGVFGSIVEDLPSLIGDPVVAAEWLEKNHGIYLTTTFAEAMGFISSREEMKKIDYVVLDIDVNPYDFPEDLEGAWAQIGPLLKRCYDYKKVDDQGNPKFDAPYLLRGLEPETERTTSNPFGNGILAQLKEVAGYHLWAHLVIETAFPKERILFCSNNGMYRDAHKRAFLGAKLESPPVFEKGTPEVASWIKQKARAPYTTLRRCVIDSCKEICTTLEKESSGKFIRMSDFPGPATAEFGEDYAYELLETIPHHLPPFVDELNIGPILNGFVRASVAEWDSFRVSSKTSQDKKLIDERESYEKRVGMTYEKKVPLQYRSAASVLKLLRNTLAHRTNKSMRLNSEDAALFFVLNMVTIFNFEMTAPPEKFSELLSLTETSQLTAENIRERLINGCEDVTQLANHYRCSLKSNPGFGDILRKLQEGNVKGYLERAPQYLFQMLIRELAHNVDKQKQFSNQIKNIRKGEGRIYEVANKCIGRAFEN